MPNRDAIEISDGGVRYARGVHIVCRRPELRVISVNNSGEIVREYTQSMTGEGATDKVIALIETGEALIQRDQLHATEPWFDEVPIFIPRYESPEAEETALAYLSSLIKRAQGVTKRAHRTWGSLHRRGRRPHVEVDRASEHRRENR